MSKLSKIHSIKQQKRYRNETMSILNHLNSRMNTPTLADKNLNSFKNAKPQVQSSRANYLDNSKNYQKNCYLGQSKDRERDFNQKICSKSLESKGAGGGNTNRKQNQKTKKNSYSKNKTQIQNVQEQIKNVQNISLQKRFKIIEQIFGSSEVCSAQGSSKITTIQSPTYTKLKKNVSSLNIQNFQTKNNMSTASKKTLQNYHSTEMIIKLKQKFVSFQQFVQDRRVKMIDDEIDMLMYHIIGQLKKAFFMTFDKILAETNQKMQNIQFGIQKIIEDHQKQIQKQRIRQQKMKQYYIQQIEQMLIRSLYITDKINILQQNGTFHFEKYARAIDNENYGYEQNENNEDSKIGWNKGMNQSSSSLGDSIQIQQHQFEGSVQFLPMQAFHQNKVQLKCRIV